MKLSRLGGAVSKTRSTNVGVGATQIGHRGARRADANPRAPSPARRVLPFLPTLQTDEDSDGRKLASDWGDAMLPPADLDFFSSGCRLQAAPCPCLYTSGSTSLPGPVVVVPDPFSSLGRSQVDAREGRQLGQRGQLLLPPLALSSSGQPSLLGHRPRCEFGVALGPPKPHL